MNKHNFIPLVTYRGWDEIDNCWRYGFLTKCPASNDFYIGNDKNERRVHPNSIGIYTGKDDKNGTPIFCAVNDAKYSSDIVKCGYVYAPFGFDDEHDEGYYIGTLAFQSSKGFGMLNRIKYSFSNDKEERPKGFELFPASRAEVIGNQYEEYLKETKND